MPLLGVAQMTLKAVNGHYTRPIELELRCCRWTLSFRVEDHSRNHGALPRVWHETFGPTNRHLRILCQQATPAFNELACEERSAGSTSAQMLGVKMYEQNYTMPTIRACETALPVLEENSIEGVTPVDLTCTCQTRWKRG